MNGQAPELQPLLVLLVTTVVIALSVAAGTVVARRSQRS